MQKIARALGLELTFVDAARKEEPLFRWIAERVLETRKLKARLMGKARGRKPSSFGGLKIGSDWLARSQDVHGLIPFPSDPDARYPTGSWISHLESHHASSTTSLLVPSDPKLNITEALWDPLDLSEGRQVNEGVLSTYWGHTRAIKKMLENGDESALILEDDLDVEWDLERMWSRIERKLPSDWELTFLGHCWGKELLRPAYLHPLLHQSTAPMCLHAYALSSSGAQRLLNLLEDPWTAYQAPIDTAIPTLLAQDLITSFSVEPPLVIQRKDGPSDIHKGQGSRWRGLLGDSTVDRIAMDEGKVVVEETWEGTRRDPANVFRYKTC